MKTSKITLTLLTLTAVLGSAFTTIPLGDNLKKNKEVVMKFEDEFKNKANIAITDELMADNFVHHSPFPGIPAGREGMKAIGQFVFANISDIKVTVTKIFAEGDLVGTRVEATGTHKKNQKTLNWTENHIYRLKDGKIVEWWPEGGPQLN